MQNNFINSNDTGWNKFVGIASKDKIERRIRWEKNSKFTLRTFWLK